MEAGALRENLCFAWSGDFESLKLFIKEDLKLDGTWSHPGGDKKLFSTENITISWRRSKSILWLKGENADGLMKNLCDMMLERGKYSNNSDIISKPSPSGKEFDIYNEIESLKMGQSVNRELVQTLSNSISNMAEVISNLQESVYNKSKDIADSFDSSKGKVAENCVNNLDDLHTISPIDSLGNTLMDTNGSIGLLRENPVCLDQVRASSLENKKDCEINDSLTTTSKQAECDTLTYAKVVASKPTLNSANEKENALKPQQKINTPNNNSEISADGFVGVKRRRNRTKRLFLSGIASSVNEKHIQSYLERRNINPTYISVFPSKRKGTVSAKVHISCADLPFVQKDHFWPKFVICKLWQSKESLGKTSKRHTKISQGGNLSTYV